MTGTLGGDVRAEREPRLAQAFRGALEIGCAVGGMLPESLSPQERELLTSHFASLTPENCMKPEPIHPEPARYDFTVADAFVRFAEAHGLRSVGHTLCWHQQCPDWFFQPDADSRSVRERLYEHIQTVAGRYSGQLYGWDVVNEAIADDAALAVAGYLRDTPWLRALGEDYIAFAFEAASEADPRAELYYNDYNLERPDKRERALRLLRSLLDRGIRVAGVGIQGHWLVDQVPFEDIERAIEDYAALGLKVMFTEVDLDVIERPDCSADLAVQRAYSLADDIYRAGCPPEVLERQADQYARLFRLFAAAKAVTRVTFWGLDDGRSWLNSWPGKRTNHPLLFDRECRPKPAFWRVIEASAGLR